MPGVMSRRADDLQTAGKRQRLTICDVLVNPERLDLLIRIPHHSKRQFLHEAARRRHGTKWPTAFGERSIGCMHIGPCVRCPEDRRRTANVIGVAMRKDEMLEVGSALAEPGDCIEYDLLLSGKARVHQHQPVTVFQQNGVRIAECEQPCAGCNPVDAHVRNSDCTLVSRYAETHVANVNMRPYVDNVNTDMRDFCMNTRSILPATPSTPYHHGDLRRALLDAANAILAETGRWDFSLREVARRAGVSHNAPYRHFVDKEALLTAIGVAGFEALNRATSAAVKDTADPVETIRTLGQAYIRFGVSYPALYRLMFGQGLSGAEGLSPALREAVAIARARLRDVVLWGARTGVFRVDPDNADEVTATVVAAWSFVHGLTSLTIDHVIEREVGQGVTDNLATQAIDRFIAGLIRAAD